MGITSIIFLGLFFCFCTGLIVYIYYKTYCGELINFKSSEFSFWMGFTACLGFVSMFLSFMDMENPTAIDVYRGKTVMEVIYKDGTPSDSIVKFKDKKRVD